MELLDRLEENGMTTTCCLSVYECDFRLDLASVFTEFPQINKIILEVMKKGLFFYFPRGIFQKNREGDSM